MRCGAAAVQLDRDLDLRLLVFRVSAQPYVRHRTDYE